MDLNWVREIIESEFMNSVFSGLIASLFFALSLYAIQSRRYCKNLKKKFNNKTFHSYYKRFPDEIIQEIICTVKGNVLKYKGTNILDGRTFNGEFIFNPINLKIGEGYQAYEDSEAFNFTKVIIKSDCCFLVDAPYVAMKEVKPKEKILKANELEIKKKDVYGIFIPEAFVWRKVD